MEIIKKIGGWAKELSQVGLSLIALGVVLEVLFKGSAIPFWPDISVVSNIMSILSGLSAEGLLGLVALLFILHLFGYKGK